MVINDHACLGFDPEVADDGVVQRHSDGGVGGASCTPCAAGHLEAGGIAQALVEIRFVDALLKVKELNAIHDPVVIDVFCRGRHSSFGVVDRVVASVDTEGKGVLVSSSRGFGGGTARLVDSQRGWVGFWRCGLPV